MDMDKMIYDSLIKDGFFNALQEQETGGKSNPNIALGDNNESLGSLQIQKPYFDDAMVQYNKDTDLQNTFPELKNVKYNNVTNRDTAQKIVYMYSKRWEPKLLQKKDYKSLYRLHNGGPSWSRQYDTMYIKANPKKNNLVNDIPIQETERKLWRNALQFSNEVMNKFTGAK
tara:strand:+ start:842 stop:1354 length:513 start_codon:yes stop_codon:yes gene_type:complete